MHCVRHVVLCVGAHHRQRGAVGLNLASGGGSVGPLGKLRGTPDHFAPPGPQELIEAYVRLANKSKDLLNIGYVRSSEERGPLLGFRGGGAGRSPSRSGESEVLALGALQG